MGYICSEQTKASSCVASGMQHIEHGSAFNKMLFSCNMQWNEVKWERRKLAHIWNCISSCCTVVHMTTKMQNIKERAIMFITRLSAVLNGTIIESSPTLFVVQIHSLTHFVKCLLTLKLSRALHPIITLRILCCAVLLVLTWSECRKNDENWHVQTKVIQLANPK